MKYMATFTLSIYEYRNIIMTVAMKPIVISHLLVDNKTKPKMSVLVSI